MGVSDASRLSDLSDRAQALNDAIATLIAAPPPAAHLQRPPLLQKQSAAHGHGPLDRSRPGERRRRRRRKTAEAVAARELRQQQASTAAAIPLAAFARVQRHAATGGFMCGGIWHTRAALEGARARAEEHMVKVFDAAQGLAAHGKRKRVMERDLALALRIGGSFAT